MADIQKKKRRAMSIQDMVSDDSGDYGRRSEPQRRSEPKHRSSYSGPRRPQAGSGDMRSSTRSIDDYDRAERGRSTGSSYVNTVDGYGYSGREGSRGNAGRTAAQSGGSTIMGSLNGQRNSGGYKVTFHAGGIMDYAWIAYIGILAFCLMVAMIAYGKGSKSSGGIYYPRHLLTTNGILDQIYDKYKSGAVASNGTAEGDINNADGANPNAAADSASADAQGADTLGSDATTTGGTTSVLPNSTTGATMAIDDGTPYGSYAVASSHEEVVAQLGSALSSGDVEFVGRKLAYIDETTGNLIGFPQSVVEHFTTYMAANPDKRELFLSEISSTDYTTKNGDAFIVKLPLLKFTVNMGYDDTTLSISGFSDQTLNAGQSATVQPLLPCMYTISVSTSSGSQSSEVEANMNEGNLQINIGVAN